MENTTMEAAAADISEVADNVSVRMIKPRAGWQVIDFHELKEYRDLFLFLVWRDIKILYAQTILGFSWAILNPLLQILIFTIVFGRVAKIATGDTPYILFCTVAIIPWTYISEAMTASSQSLVLGQDMLGKVYFPRLMFPMSPVFSKLLDFGISMILIVGVLVYYKVSPSWNLLMLPIFIMMMIIVPAGVGLWLSAMAIRFRDVKFAMQFIIRMLMYSAPIVYSAVGMPEAYRKIYILNPIVGVVEGFRACLLGQAMPWDSILTGAVTATLVLLGGAMYFQRMERVFVDVI